MATITIEHLYCNGNRDNVRVGAEATMLLYSDTHAGTVIYVSPSGKTIKVQRDRAKLISGSTMSEEQGWTYERDSQGAITTYRFSAKHGWINRNAAARRCLVGQRREWRDPTF